MPNDLIFIVDDDPALRKLTSILLEDRAYATKTFESGEDCLDALDERPSAILLDMMLPGINGLETLEQIKLKSSSTPVILVTSINKTDTAVSAMKQGAYDYLVKPYDETRLIASLEKALQQDALNTHVHFLKTEINKLKTPQGIVGNSPAILEVVSKSKMGAESGAAILIQGESGTGKELLARTVHENSLWSDGLFVDINCGAIPETLQESELFGHKKGAFTGATEMQKGKLELAHHGTLFLDEIGEMTLPTQAKLLRFLQEKNFERIGEHRKIQVECQIVSATNKDLKEAVAQGSFREDLYYRLAVFPVTAPPLRERKQDIPLLCQHFLTKYKTQIRKHHTDIHPQALQMLMNHSWPGNIRELENAIFQAMILATGEILQVEDFHFIHPPISSAIPTPSSTNETSCDTNKILSLDETIKSAIQNALTASNGKANLAGEKLGLSRSAFYRLLKKYDIR